MRAYGFTTYHSRRWRTDGSQPSSLASCLNSPSMGRARGCRHVTAPNVYCSSAPGCNSTMVELQLDYHYYCPYCRCCYLSLAPRDYCYSSSRATKSLILCDMLLDLYSKEHHETSITPSVLSTTTTVCNEVGITVLVSLHIQSSWWRNTLNFQTAV